jgi:signal transduction histidine kinase
VFAEALPEAMKKPALFRIQKGLLSKKNNSIGMNAVIVLDLVSVFLAFAVYTLGRMVEHKRVRPGIAAFYLAAVLVTGLALLEISGVVPSQPSPGNVLVHLAMLVILLLIALSLNKMKISQLRSELERGAVVQKMKREFLAITSHELKTPLSPMLIQLQMLNAGSSGPLNEKQRKSVAIVERNLKRLSRLVEDITLMSRATAGVIELDKKSFDLNEVLLEAVETMKPFASEKNISILFEGGKIPLAHADPDRMATVAINLLDNAVKFGKQGGKVWVESAFDGDSIVVSVRDNGKGIKRENLKNLFQPFSVLSHYSTRAVGGLGLGLSISKKIAELHGGRIWAESRGLKKGATFFFSIPARA